MSGFTKLEMAVISVRVQRENTKKDAKKLDILLYDVSVCGLLLVHQLHVLNIDGFLHLDALLLARLFESLAGAELADGAGLFELPLESFQGAFDVLAFFNGYYDHFFTTSFSQ